MKALVLSGGSGTRLRPFTHSLPKQLIPVANRPILFHVLDAIAALGVREIGVVVDAGDRHIRAAVGDGAEFGARVTYIPQDRPLGLAHCVLIARDFLGDEDFVLYLGDNVILGDLAGPIADFRARGCAAGLMTAKVADPSEYGIAELDADGRVRALVEKPADPRGDLAVMGVYYFTRPVHEAVRSISPSGRGELEITDAVQWLLGHGYDVGAHRFDGYWRDAGRLDDLLDCNRTLLGHRPRALRGHVDAASTVHGDVVVEAGAEVVRSTLTGPVVIGAGARVADSRVGPDVAVGAGCELHGTQIEDSVLLDGARLDGLRAVRGSLIGRSARIGPAAGAWQRVVVGDDARLDVAP